MPILQTASIQDLKRLLDLFPLTSLRRRWPELKGTKEELCYEIAGRRDVDTLVQFLDEYISCCRQHVYVFSHDIDRGVPPEIELIDGERILETEDNNRLRALYVIRFGYTVILKEPLEEATLEFLWPLRLEFTREHLIVRFVILEKNIGSYFEGRSLYVDRRSIEEKGVLTQIRAAFGGRLTPADLHKGVKELWEADFMDSSRTRYKKSISTASEAMDEERGIKEHNPELYAALVESPLLNTMFRVAPREGFSVTAFSVDPSEGAVTFPRYSDNPGDTDYVVNEILRHNR